MQVAQSLLSALPLLFVLGFSACGESSKQEGKSGSEAKSALQQAAEDAQKDKPVIAGLGDYLSPGASADAIMMAAREGNAELVRLLINEKVNVDFALPDGLNSLHVAVGEGHLDVVKVLLENKANPNARQAAGATAIILALQGKRLDMLKLLLAHGADPNIAMLNGMFPLMMFDEFKWDRKEQVELAELLAAAGANLNQRLEAKSNTALMIYTANGNVEMVKWLLSRDVKVNIKGSEGYTALAFSAITNQLEPARLLVASGADLTLLNNNGDTAAQIAERTQQVGVVGYLRQQEAKRGIKSEPAKY